MVVTSNGTGGFRFSDVFAPLFGGKPVILSEVLASIRYRPGWTFNVEAFGGGQAAVLVIKTPVKDSWSGEPRILEPTFPVENQSWLQTADVIEPWMRKNIEDWVWDCITAYERHERGEWFACEHGKTRPYYPDHSSPWDVHRLPDEMVQAQRDREW